MRCSIIHFSDILSPNMEHGRCVLVIIRQSKVCCHILSMQNTTETFEMFHYHTHSPANQPSKKRLLFANDIFKTNILFYIVCTCRHATLAWRPARYFSEGNASKRKLMQSNLKEDLTHRQAANKQNSSSLFNLDLLHSTNKMTWCMK